MKFLRDFYWYPLRKPFTHLFGRGFSCNVFAIDQGDEIWLIDVGSSPWNRFNKLLKNMREDGLNPDKITKIFLTHAHSDHVGALDKLINLSHPKIYIHTADSELLKGGYEFFVKNEIKASQGLEKDLLRVPIFIFKNLINYPMGKQPKVTDFIALEDNEVILGSKYNLQILNTPGHTPGHTVFYEEKNKIAFLGDLIDPSYDHKVSLNFPSVDFEEYKNSLEKIRKLDVEITCGAHAEKIHLGKVFYEELIDGALEKLDFAMEITLMYLKQPGGVCLNDFYGKFPKTIWQLQEQVSVPFSIINFLKKSGHICQKGNRFYYITKE